MYFIKSKLLNRKIKQYAPELTSEIAVELPRMPYLFVVVHLGNSLSSLKTQMSTAATLHAIFPRRS